MKQKRVRNLPWRNGSTTIAEKNREGSVPVEATPQQWPEEEVGGRRRKLRKGETREGRERDERESKRREMEVQHIGLIRVVVAMAGGGRRWPKVARGCGGSGCSGERENGRSYRGAGAGKKKGS